MPLALIVVDTLAASANFGDENSAAEGQQALNVLRAASTATGAVALAVDHFGKNQESGTRGTTAKEASADFVLALLGDRELSGKLSNSRMAVRKVREGRVGYEVPFTVKEVVLGTDRDGEQVTTCIIEWGKPGDARPKPKRKTQTQIDLANAMQEALRLHGQTIQRGPDQIRGAPRKHLLEAFKKIRCADDQSPKAIHAAHQAFRRVLEDELQEPDASMVRVEVAGEEFIGPAPEPM